MRHIDPRRCPAFSDFKKGQLIEVKGSSVFILAKGKLEAMIDA